MVATLMAGCLAAGVAVSNERGVFVPPHSLSAAFAATARAFAALTGPGSLQPLNLFYNPFAAEAYRLPNQIAQQIVNPAPAPANPLPGVFGAPPAAAAPFAVAPGAAPAPVGGGVGPGAPGGVGPLAPPGTGGFTGIPVPIQDFGTTPPGQPGTVTPPVIIPGGGTTPPFVVPPPGIVPPPTIFTPPTPPTIVIPPIVTPPVVVPPVIVPPVIVPPCIGVACTPVTPPVNPPEIPPTGAVPEPASWAMLILGFGIVGGLQRLVGRRKARAAG